MRLLKLCNVVICAGIIFGISSGVRPASYAYANDEESKKDPVVWMREIGLDVDHMVIDHEDSVYLVGMFQGRLGFNSATNEIVKTLDEKSSPNNGFVVKFDSSGKLKWGTMMIFDSSGGFANVKIDNTNSLYITGEFEELMAIETPHDTKELSSEKQYAKFLCKLDKNGSCVLTKKWGTDDPTDYISDFAVDQDQNIYLGMESSGGLEIDSWAGRNILTEAVAQAMNYGNPYTPFICKYDMDGNFKWLKAWPPEQVFSHLFIDRIEVGSNGRIDITGSFNGRQDFDPNEGTVTKTGGSRGDIFLLILDLDGNFKNVLTWGSAEYIYQDGLIVDKENNVYLYGRFQDKADFDPGPGVVYRISDRNIDYSPDIFILKLDSDLKYQWVTTWAGLGNISSTIFIDQSGNVYEIAVDEPKNENNYVDLKDEKKTTYYIRKYDEDGKLEGASTWFDKTKTVGGFLNIDSKGEFYVYGERGTKYLFKLKSLEFGRKVKAFPDLPDRKAGFNDFAENFKKNVKTVRDEKGLGWKVKSSGGFDITTSGICSSVNDDIYVIGNINYGNSVFSGVDFVGKWGKNGNCRWLKVWDDANLETSGIVTDKKGNVYIAGHLSGTVDFDPGPAAYDVSSFDTHDYFVCKFDSNADLKWVSIVTRQESYSRPFSIAVDDNSDVYLAFHSSENFYPGIKAGKPYDDPGISIKGNLIKMNSIGSLLWIKQFIPGKVSNPDNVYVFLEGLSVNSKGDILLSGEYHYHLEPSQLEKKGGRFVANLDSDGNEIKSWVWQGTNQGIYYLKAIMSPDGAIYVCGDFTGDVDFDPGPEVMLVESSMFPDGHSFVLKISESGKFEWVKTWEPNQAWWLALFGYIVMIDNPFTNFLLNSSTEKFPAIIPSHYMGSQTINIVSDHDQAVYVFGNFAGIIDFYGNDGSLHRIASGITRLTEFVNGVAFDTDSFISKFDNVGKFRNVMTFPGFIYNGDYYPRQEMAIDSRDNLYVLVESKASMVNMLEARKYPSSEKEKWEGVFIMKVPSSTFSEK
jgi:hypothetical protein